MQAQEGNIYFTELAERVEYGNYEDVLWDVNVFTHIVVYAKSALVEQSTPVASSADTLADHYTIYDSVSFTDLDLDDGQVGGEVQWVPLYSGTSITTHFNVYMTAGAGRSQIGSSVARGTNEISLPQDTPPTGTIKVFSKSVLAEQSTPGVVSFSDSDESVSGIAFPDLDLDVDEEQ